MGKTSGGTAGSHDSDRKQNTGFRASGKVKSKKKESRNKFLKAQLFECFYHVLPVYSSLMLNIRLYFEAPTFLKMMKILLS